MESAPRCPSQEASTDASCRPLSTLANLRTTRAVLDAHGLQAKYSLGQNFLVNEAIIEKIVKVADLQPEDRVLEIGPGIGTLTMALLKCSAQVTSIERDTDLPPVLADTLASWADRFTLIQKDALDLQLGDLMEDASGGSDPNVPQVAVAQSDASGTGSVAQLPNKLVANLPYAVAATVVLDYFERFDFLESATVMVQKEVADRMAAQPGVKDYGAYTIKLRLFAEPAGRFSVGPNNFFPAPRVESSVIRLNRRPLLLDEQGKLIDQTSATATANELAVAASNEYAATPNEYAAATPASPELLQATCTMVDAAFASRRKTISNSFKTYFAGRGAQGASIMPQLPQLLEAADIDPRRRGETLSLEEFLALGQAYVSRAQ